MYVLMLRYDWCQSVYLLSLQTLELDSLMLGLERRLPKLQEDVSVLEREDDGDLYGALSLLVIENELTEIKQLIHKLNMTTQGHQRLITDANEQVDLHKMVQWVFHFELVKMPIVNLH